MSIKPYLYLICGKKIRCRSGLTKYLDVCKDHFYPKPAHKPLPHEPPLNKSHNEENLWGENWEDRSDLFGKTVTKTTANGTFQMLTEDTPKKGLFASESLATLRQEWLSNHKFPADTSISDKKYKHLGSKYKNCFYPFNDQLDYGIAHEFANSETTKSNMNKFLTDSLMAPFTEKLSYKNINE